MHHHCSVGGAVVAGEWGRDGGQSLGPQVREGWLVTGEGSLGSGESRPEAQGVQIRTEALQAPGLLDSEGTGGSPGPPNRGDGTVGLGGHRACISPHLPGINLGQPFGTVGAVFPGPEAGQL